MSIIIHNLSIIYFDRINRFNIIINCILCNNRDYARFIIYIFTILYLQVFCGLNSNRSSSCQKLFTERRGANFLIQVDFSNFNGILWMSSNWYISYLHTLKKTICFDNYFCIQILHSQWIWRICESKMMIVLSYIHNKLTCNKI